MPSKHTLQTPRHNQNIFTHCLNLASQNKRDFTLEEHQGV